MRRSAWLRLLILFVVICAFAAVAAVVKGHHGGVRNAIGNLSAPWVLVPFLAGAFVLPRRLALGALVGTASTAAALACYSFVRAAGGGSGRASFDLIAASGNRWLLIGVIGGVGLGATGSWLAARGRWTVVTAVVAGLLVLEPVARMFWAITRGYPVGTFVPSPVVWSVEILCGCASVIGFHVLRARYR